MWELWGRFVGDMAELGRRTMLALGAVTVLAACTSPAKKAASGKVRTDAEPLERRFAALGSLSGAHWLGTVLGTDSRMSVPGPTDIRVVGTAQLRAGAVAAITEAPQWSFRPGMPGQLPGALTEFMPKGARWVRSDAFDREVTGGRYSGTFYLDPGTDAVYFDTTNPSVAASTGP
ncbi:hypothetical protein FCH28_24440 [Streptomyces piniterrae]|uniref:Uncharacterized protein n=1 Tax=Streptomyces piniterrae TaxID=2571125 RepID=A0A4U0N7U0_9ACTN|nr:hypothetical protein [Streptomyces piniterrae]TJZ49462.1 hypothetical protein FCH28_24440 [Streptomyces piniterrae]